MFSVSGAARIRFLLAVVSLTLLLTATGCLDVKIGDKTYPKDTEYLTVTDNNIEDYAVFNRFDKLKTLDLTSIDISPAEFDSISSKVKDSVQILWNVPLGNRKFPNFTRSLDISPELNLTDAAALRYFVNLNAVTVTSIPPSELLAKICGTVREVNPQAVINCSTSVYGVEVDSETELYIQDQLRNLPFACTKFIIAQRISSMRDADLILVMQNGRITEQGTHKELLEKRGYYWQTYCLQYGIPMEEAV